MKNKIMLKDLNAKLYKAIQHSDKICFDYISAGLSVNVLLNHSCGISIGNTAKNHLNFSNKPVSSKKKSSYYLKYVDLCLIFELKQFFL